MLVKADHKDMKKIIDFLNEEPARNYFILLSLLKGFSTYKEIWLEKTELKINSGIFLRQSGNLQISLTAKSNHKIIESWLLDNEFNLLISPKSYCQPFEKHLNLVKIGAEISCLNKNEFTALNNNEKTCKLEKTDLSLVIKLYENVFEGYPKEKYMADKLEANRGIGFYIPPMKSVAQSDMGCVIVGVATALEYQSKGLGRLVLSRLIEELFKVYEDVYLQYEDDRAKALYLSMGFRKIDDVYHYEKRHK